MFSVNEGIYRIYIRKKNKITNHAQEKQKMEDKMEGRRKEYGAGQEGRNQIE